MEGKIISRLLTECPDIVNLFDEGAELVVYHPIYGISSPISKDYRDLYVVKFNKGALFIIDRKHFMSTFRVIVFRRKYHKPVSTVEEYPIPSRLWYTAWVKGWLDHPTIIDADIIEGYAIVFGPCEVGCK